MKTSIIEHILKPANRIRLRAFFSAAAGSRSSVAGLLIFALSWSLVLPFIVHAERPADSRPPVAPASPASQPLTQASETFVVYGPTRFTRNSGAPVNVVQNFSLPADATAPFSILVENGALSGSNRVSSATIKLNGTSLYTSNDFNQNVASLTKPVTLTATNTLEVKLASAPGSYLTITFKATRTATAPSLNSVAPARATQGQTLSVTLHGTNTHWVAGQTRVSLGGEVAIGGNPFGELGPVTVVDATTVMAAVVVSSTAALEPRTARVVTAPLGGGSDESVSLTNSFTVDAATPPGAASSIVSTIAGTLGVAGFVDGNGPAARFRNINGVAIGPDDAIYIADSGNQSIRVVRATSSGGVTNWTVSTLAGHGLAGFADGPGASARFNNPQGVAVDAAGVVYVADTANNRIRRIASDGTVSTLAGDGTPGLQNGAGSQARFNAPQGVATDNQGNVYVADTGNAAVRLINGGGTVSTLAGDGTVGSSDSPGARFDGLVGIAVEGQNVYVYLADTGNHRIRRLDVAGTVITLTGLERGFKDGSASQSRFAEPSGIAMDGASKIVVGDSVNSLIRLVDPDLAINGSNQAVTTLAGTGIRGLTDGAGDVARFFTPRGLAVSNSSAIIVADTGNQVLRRILLPPIITALTPPSARLGDTITINGERFDGRSAAGNVVRFKRSAQAGGGQTFGSVTQATRTAITVVVPADATTGPLTVQTEGGTATSPSDFVLSVYSAPVITDFNPKRGTPGIQVTLTGTNLKVNAIDPTVTFTGSNGIRLPALVNSASATEVHTTVPNGAITGVIELTHGGGTAATAAPFTVDSEQDFQLTVAPSTTTAVQGGSGTYVVYVTSAQSTFSQLASLTATGLPAGITATFDPAQITAGASSTLTLNLSGAIAPGSYPLTIHGVASLGGHDLEHTAGATLNVMVGGQTTLSGRVLSTEREPIIGATASLDGHTAMTDAAGAFLLTGVTAGTNRPLMIDGRTASSPNRTYPVIIEPANIVSGQANVNPYTFYLPPIDTQYEVEVVPGQNTVASNPRVPGLQMTIPPGANLRNRDNSPVARVSITPLSIDRTPAPLPSNVSTALVYTSQPGGAISDIPMPVVYPNLLGTNPGTQVNLYAFNHDTVQWYIYGTGTVSNDGRTIVPNINPNTGNRYGLTDFSWHFPSASPDGDPGPDDDCPSNDTDMPVDLSTGMKKETATDFGFGGARGALNLTRIYTSDLAQTCDSCPFGRGTTHNYAVTLSGSFQAGGAGRLTLPGQRTGELYSYVRTDLDGSLVFTSTGMVSGLGDVVRRLANGTLEHRSGDGQVMRFDGSGRLIALVDRNGNTTTLTYTGANLTSITDPVNRSITLDYDFSNRVRQATDPLGRVWHYTYEGTPGVAGLPGLTTVTDPLNGVTRYSYVVGGRLASVTDARGNLVKQITYDVNGRVIEQRFADGGVERYAYTLSGAIVTSASFTDTLGRIDSKRFNASGYVIAATDPSGQSSRYERAITTNLKTATTGSCGCTENTQEFDERGNVTAMTDKLGQTERTEYEPIYNNVVRRTDKLGRVTTYGYDVHGNVTSITDAQNHTTNVTYDSFGEMISFTDPLGHTTQFEYDALGNLTATINALGNRVTAEYDAIGRATAEVDALNRRTTFQYDALSRVIVKIEPSGASLRSEFDTNGNLTKSTDALARHLVSVYDGKNRLVSITDPLGRVHRSLYDAGDQLTSTISPSGRTLRYGYDGRGLRISQTDPSGGVMRYTYDSENKVVALTDQRGNTTTFTYDELHRLASVRDPLGQILSTKYDAVDNITEETDRLGRIIRNSYDALDRLTQAVYADSVVTFTYDAAGGLIGISDTSGGNIQRTYDDADRLLSETTAAGTVTYAYNASGQPLTTTAADRSPVNYQYDAAGRVQSISQGGETFTYSYDVLSRIASLQRPNGVSTTRTYDAVDRLTRLTHGHSGNAAIEDFSYTYTAEDEIASITSLASAAPLPGPKSATPANAANRVTQLGSSAYTFDGLGAITSKGSAQGTTQYDWDARGRMVRATLPNSQTINYTYDALGRRTSRTANALTTNFLYDGNTIVLDRAGNGSTVDYLDGLNIDEHLRQSGSASGPLYFLPDHLGSTAALTDASGNLSERISYESFGNSSGSSLTRYTYTGREADEATGLIYYRGRWYDPEQGRFVSEDPKGFLGGFNLYVYVDNQPTGGVDPFGLQYAPLSPGTERRIDISRDELERMMNPSGSLPASVRRNLDRGCIGMCSAYQGTGTPFPENAPRTFCYRTQAAAQARRCPRCCDSFVFAKQGDWTGGRAPRGGRGGRVPNNSISSAGGHYNYIVYFPSTDSYSWMNFATRYATPGDPQMASIARFPVNDPSHYAHEIWCSTCKRRGR